MSKKNKMFHCKFCNFSTNGYKLLSKHFKEQHKSKQPTKTQFQKLQKQVNKRLKEGKSKAYAYQEIRKIGTFHENVVKTILKQQNAYFEFQPLIFSEELKVEISPDFFVTSWKNKKLTVPFYLEIDGNNKDRTDVYQIEREKTLKKRYPILRIWNSNVNEKNILYLIEKYIEQTEEIFKKLQKQKVIDRIKMSWKTSCEKVQMGKQE